MSVLPAALPAPLGGSTAVALPPLYGPQAQAALDRLALQFKDKPNLVGLIAALAASADRLETVVAQLKTLPSIDQSSGTQLDILGEILGEPRRGFDDGAYQLHLKARAFLNRSSGTGEDLYHLFQLLIDVPLQMQEQWPAAFEVLILSTALDPTLAGYLYAILQQAKPMGVRAILRWLNAPPTQSFCFAGGPGLGFDSGIWSSAE